MKNISYEAKFIWKLREDLSVLIYSCFVRISDGMCCIQNSSAFYAGEGSEQWGRILKVTGDLFIDDDLDARVRWFPSIDAAIADHDTGFS